MKTGVFIEDVSPIYRQHLDQHYPDPSTRAEILNAVAAAYVPAERRIYIVDPHPGTIVHEAGDVVDVALSNHGGWSSRSDNFLGRRPAA